MGRTKRKRHRKLRRNPSASLENKEAIINLKRWMRSSDWINDTYLQLREYSDTGRGVTSTKNLHVNDVLIRVPHKLLITYDTIISSNIKSLLSRTPLTMHEYLSLFLIIEHHKGEESDWKFYIQSLPSKIPDLLWLYPLDVIKLLPEEIREATLRLLSDFEKSWLRVRQSIDLSWTCNHCSGEADCVINKNIFMWAYVLVNSRAVYFDPRAVGKMCDYSADTLSDEPSMALCPYLDMFNHSSAALTDAELVNYEGQVFYQLRTVYGYDKYDQIFISYGPHDNLKLLLEYGFFIPRNPFDRVACQFEEISDVLKLVFDQHQYRYVKEHNLNSDLFVTDSGASFNLKSVLFVASNAEIRNYSEFIYSDTIDLSFSSTLYGYVNRLLDYKLAVYKSELDTFKASVEDSEKIELIFKFLENRIQMVQGFLTR